MKPVDSKIYYVIGMSPGNSYFKDEEIKYLLKTTVERFGRVAILIADIPAISTYVAFGYPENRARRDKAIPRGNSLKNKVRRAMEQLGYSDDIVNIVDWESQVENNAQYLEQYKKVQSLYDSNPAFQESANATTRAVLEGSNNKIEDIDAATRIAVHYLLSELAFLELGPVFFGVEKVVYIYHKNWLVYEDYIAGRFDHVLRPYLDFLLLENPYETFNPIWGLEDEEEKDDFKNILERVEATKILRVGFSNYPPAFMYDKDYDNFSGIFYEVIVGIAKKQGWKIRWVEEVGYGVITDGLDHKRFDIFGSAVWPTPERLEQASFSIPLYKSSAFAWIRSDYHKSNEEIKNDENARVAIRENDISDSVAKSEFPHNRVVQLPQLADTTELLEFVADGRADFTFVEPFLAQYFNAKSSVKLIPSSDQPIATFDNVFMFKKGEENFKKFIDKELEILKGDGTIKSLIRKYTGSEDTFLDS